MISLARLGTPGAMRATMHLARAVLLLFAAAAALSSGACAGPTGDDVASLSESAFTVANGHRFVVSASPERIVLAKKVGGVSFPFDAGALLGKAVLIHPVDRRAAGGVYARALAVESRGDTFVIASKPLTLAEMEAITEDEIVRIYIDDKRTPLRPASVTPLGAVRPQSAGAFGVEGLSFASSLGLARPALFAPGVTFAHDIARAELAPEVLFDWTAEKGLELGLRATMSWRSKLVIGGRGGGEIYRSAVIETPPHVAIIPIGSAPVPVSFSAAAFVTCSAEVTGPLAVAVDLEADAMVAGSFTVQPSLTAAPADWVHPGAWAPEAKGTASAKASLEPKESVAVACAVPRIELKALVASTAGPYIGITPVASMSGPSPTVAVSMSAGVQGTLLGVAAGAEMTLLEWKP